MRSRARRLGRSPCSGGLTHVNFAPADWPTLPPMPRTALGTVAMKDRHSHPSEISAADAGRWTEGTELVDAWRAADRKARAAEAEVSRAFLQALDGHGEAPPESRRARAKILREHANELLGAAQADLHRRARALQDSKPVPGSGEWGRT